MLEFRSIKKYPSFCLDVSMMFRDGMVTALFGKSGSGKTTIINQIAGLQNPDQGRIAVGDRLLFDSYQNINLPAKSRNAGYIFQDGRLFPHMTVESNLRYGMKKNAGQNIGMFKEVTELLGIKHLLDRRPSRLSGGEKQRTAIGRALLSSPDFLLMDEPLSALDTARKDELIPFIGKLVERYRLPVVYVTHSTEELFRLCDNVILMENGQAADSGTVEDVVSNPSNTSLLGLSGRVSVIRAEAVSPEETEGKVIIRDSRMLIPTKTQKPGTKMRVTIHSDDITLSVKKPEGLSARNIIKGTVKNMDETPDGAVSILVDIGIEVYATVTKTAVSELCIETGSEIYTILKTIALSRKSTPLIKQ